MKRFESLSDLLAHWGRQADKYTALNRLREYYDEQREIIAAPFHRKLLEYAEKHSAASVTPEIRDSLCSEIRDEMTQLRDWYGRMTKEIIDYYEKKDPE